ncbi:MAG: hypothetical protein QOI07_3810 [Verrucomicrobiota bacterium]|jgi:hypothetical protein
MIFDRCHGALPKRARHCQRPPPGIYAAKRSTERSGRTNIDRDCAPGMIEDGQTIRGGLIGSTKLASGRFAMIDDGLGFSLVPWRPVIEKEIGREVIGVMRGGDVSWQLGRKLGLGI